MYLHQTQAHIHLRLWSKATGASHEALNANQNTEPLLKGPIYFPGRYIPKPSLASSLGGQTWKVNHSAVRTWAQPRHFNLSFVPFFCPARVPVGWLSAQIVSFLVFSNFLLQLSPPPAPLLLGHQQQMEWTLWHPSHRAKHIPSEQSLPPPLRNTRHLLCFPAMPSSQVFVTAMCPRLLTTFFLLSLLSCSLRHPSPAPALAPPMRLSTQGLHFSATCKPGGSYLIKCL